MGDYSSDDVSTICGGILKRIKGEMSDEHYGSFKKMLDDSSFNILCKQCEDTGLFFDGGWVVCRACDYHSRRGRKLAIREPQSVTEERDRRR